MALTYGAFSNPEQSFRVIQSICRRTHDKQLLAKAGINLLEELIARSAHKIRRKIIKEYQANANFRYALKHVFLTKQNKGYDLVKNMMGSYYYL